MQAWKARLGILCNLFTKKNSIHEKLQSINTLLNPLITWPLNEFQTIFTCCACQWFSVLFTRKFTTFYYGFFLEQKVILYIHSPSIFTGQAQSIWLNLHLYILLIATSQNLCIWIHPTTSCPVTMTSNFSSNKNVYMNNYTYQVDTF